MFEFGQLSKFQEAYNKIIYFYKETKTINYAKNEQDLLRKLRGKQTMPKKLKQIYEYPSIQWPLLKIEN